MEHHTNGCKRTFLLYLFSSFTAHTSFQHNGKDFIFGFLWLTHSYKNAPLILYFTHGPVQTWAMDLVSAALITSCGGFTWSGELKFICRVISPSCWQVHIQTDYLYLEACAMKMHTWQQELYCTSDYNAQEMSHFIYNLLHNSDIQEIMSHSGSPTCSCGWVSWFLSSLHFYSMPEAPFSMPEGKGE